jgi:G3E family GTPase
MVLLLVFAAAAWLSSKTSPAVGFTCHCCQQHLEEEAGGGINEIAQQLAFSDLILLNKVDLIDEKQLDVVKSAVRRINQSAKLLDCQLNQEGKEPSLSLLLENNSFNVNKALKVDPEFLHSDSGSDMSDTDTDSEDSDSDCGREGGSDNHIAAAATAAPVTAAGTEAEGSSGLSLQLDRKQPVTASEQPPAAAGGAGAAASKALAEQHQQTVVQADSSQQTSQSVLQGGCGGCAGTAGVKRQHAGGAAQAADDSSVHYTKVGKTETWATNVCPA